MKIDEFIREATVKADAVAKGKSETVTSSEMNVGDILTEISSDADFAFPDLLQAFGRMVNRRQQLSDSLPTAVRERLTESRRASIDSSASVGSASSDNSEQRTSIQQGVSGLVRENRSSMNSMRQIAAELEYVERLPELSEVFTTHAVNAKTTVQPEGPRPAAAQNQGAQLNFTPEALQTVVDEGLNTLQTIAAVTEKVIATPGSLLASLVDKAIQSGTMGKELSDWVDTVTVVLNRVAEDPAMSVQLIDKLPSVEPKVLQLSTLMEKPELVKVWAATQAWGSNLMQETVSSTATVSTTSVTSATVPLNSSSPFSAGVEAIRNVLQNLAANTAETLTPQASVLATTVVASRAERLEMLLSGMNSRPETLNRLLSLLPEMVSSIEKKLPARVEGKSTATMYDTLARSAPKWLQTMAESTEKPELLELWVASKMSDLAPWAKLSSSERQQATINLKELATTYDQPDVFRTTSEDSSSRGLMLQAALYSPEQGKSYPALIQIFEEKREKGNGQLPEQEVWVRVSLETDNIGTVDLSFRLQDKKYLSIFSRFADPEAASEFRSNLSELRKEFAGTALELTKIAVTQRSLQGGKAGG